MGSPHFLLPCDKVNILQAVLFQVACNGRRPKALTDPSPWSFYRACLESETLGGIPG